MNRSNFASAIAGSLFGGDYDATRVASAARAPDPDKVKTRAVEFTGGSNSDYVGTPR